MRRCTTRPAACACRSTSATSWRASRPSDLVLEPHFGRLSWEEIYAGWKSDELKYYWRDLDFPVVPYDRAPFQSTEPDVEEIKEAIIYEHWRQLRHEGKAPGRGRPD